MIGFGGGQGETWGYDTVTKVEVVAQVSGYTSRDFSTAFATTSAGSSSVTNTAQLVSGDSGGGDFIYDTASGKWMLAEINEAVDDSQVPTLSS